MFLWALILMAALLVVMLVFRLFFPERYRFPEATRLELCFSFFGLLAFLCGLGLAVYDRGHYRLPGLILAGTGALTAILSNVSITSKRKAKRKHWPTVQARCTEQVLRERSSFESGHIWQWQIECEFDFEGKQFKASPMIRWNDATGNESPFWTEAKARKFLVQRIAADGRCWLRVNPTNPLETELMPPRG